MKHLASTCTFHIISVSLRQDGISDDNYFLGCKFPCCPSLIARPLCRILAIVQGPVEVRCGALLWRVEPCTGTSPYNMPVLNNHCRMEAVTGNGQIYSPLSKIPLWDLVGSPRNKIIRGSGCSDSY